MKKLFIISFVCFVAHFFCDSSWASSYALASQRNIGMDTPLNRVQFLSAHNAWNDSNNAWANQRWSIKEMLNKGIRGFDFDLHLDDDVVKVCHGGCDDFWSAPDSYSNELAKLASFVDANPKELIIIDLEDRAHDQLKVEGPLYQYFGDKLYKPSDKPTNRWETPREMLARGKQVIVKSANDTYDNSLIWKGNIFSVNASSGWNYRQVEHFNASNCTSDGTPINQDLIVGFMDSKLGKWWLPDDWVDQTGTIDEDNILNLLNCGVNFVDADRWDDDMIQASIWSWDRGEPNDANDNEDCACINANDRWNDTDCKSRMRFACQNETDLDDWQITSVAGEWEQGFDQCSREFPGYVFAVPGNAYHNKKLIDRSPGETIWIAYSDKGQEGVWDMYNDQNTTQCKLSGGNVGEESFNILRIPGAPALRVEISGYAEKNFDFVNIYNSNREQLKQFNGNFNEIFSVEDSYIIVQFITGAMNSNSHVNVSIKENHESNAPVVFRKLKNGDGKCLDLKGQSTKNGTTIHVWSCHGEDSQLWYMDSNGIIRNKKDPDKCVDVKGYSTSKGARLHLWEVHGGANQRWFRCNNNTFCISNNPNRVMDVKGSWWGAWNGQPIHLWDYHGGDSQQWHWED